MSDIVNLDRDLIENCFFRLNAKLQGAGEEGEVVLFGGAAMCLVFGSRGYTRDTVFEPKSNMYQMAKEVAKEMAIQEDWLNDGITL
ncbi:hypothetical protein [Paenibacillus koleovorans]|uniref:hypothetical protein n=1 Tax=Paenibacillus koleovorans TaxID=121608 RepID=UPI000FDA03FB|nr:hypothetical protein [Paenibacillus koleovorans]